MKSGYMHIDNKNSEDIAYIDENDFHTKHQNAIILKMRE
jgi:hypothetical protein